jgi:hypothetical protein
VEQRRGESFGSWTYLAFPLTSSLRLINYPFTLLRLWSSFTLFLILDCSLWHATPLICPPTTSLRLAQHQNGLDSSTPLPKNSPMMFLADQARVLIAISSLSTKKNWKRTSFNLGLNASLTNQPGSHPPHRHTYPQTIHARLLPFSQTLHYRSSYRQPYLILRTPRPRRSRTARCEGRVSYQSTQGPAQGQQGIG